MAREVNATQPFANKLVKLVPTEIVGAYMVLAGMLGYTYDATSAAQQMPDPELKAILIQVVFFVLLVLTPLYLWRIGRVSNLIQLVVTTISYVIWVYTLGGPFVVWGIYHSIIGSVVLVLWSITAPLLVPPNLAKEMQSQTAAPAAASPPTARCESAVSR
ncbi:MAG: hypothetical protein M1376_15260 [Planctomycetes bacterium]|nr:hypothetical protein [Planctomycetota bacterium]